MYPGVPETGVAGGDELAGVVAVGVVVVGVAAAVVVGATVVAVVVVVVVGATVVVVVTAVVVGATVVVVGVTVVVVVVVVVVGPGAVTLTVRFVSSVKMMSWPPSAGPGDFQVCPGPSMFASVAPDGHAA